MNTQSIVDHIATITGRTSDQIKNIVGHIVDVELAGVEDNEELYGDREVQIMRESVLLGESNPNIIEDLPKEVYEYLLYYYLIRINNKFLNDSGVVYVVPEIEYNGDVINDYSDVFDDSNYEVLKELSDSDEKPTNDFPMTLAYASKFDQWLMEYPLWSQVHSEIGKVYMSHPYLRFHNLDPEDMKRIILPNIREHLSALTLRGLNNFDEFEYYDKGLLGLYQYDPIMNAVPVTEQLMQVTKFAGGGAFGNTYVARFGDRIPMFAKSQFFDRMDIVHEYRVGSALNQYYDQCPFFMYTYGLSGVFMDNIDGEGYIQVYDNQSNKATNKPVVPNIPMVLFQWINNSISMANFVNRGDTTFKLDGDQIVSVSHGESLRQMLLVIMATLKYLGGKVGFSHGDLHFQNIQIMRLSRPTIIEIPGYPGTYYNSDHIPVIIDYGYASVSKLGIHSKSRGVSVPTNDRRLGFEGHYVMDVDKMYKIIVRNMDILKNYMTSQEYNDFVDNITRFHFVAITGSMLPDEDLPRVKRTMSRMIGESPNATNSFYRTLPLTSSYDPDAAVDFLMDAWYPSRNSDAMDIELSTTTSPDLTMTIPEYLKSILVKDRLFRLDTYAGALAIYQHPTLHRIPQILDPGVSDSINILNCLNNNQFLRLFGAAQGFTSKTNMMLMFIYRRQIIRFIHDYIHNNIVHNGRNRRDHQVIYIPPTITNCDQLINNYNLTPSAPSSPTYSIMDIETLPRPQDNLFTP